MAEELRGIIRFFEKLRYKLVQQEAVINFRQKTTVTSEEEKSTKKTMIPDGTVDLSCACKGIRRCLRCESSKGKGLLETNSPEVKTEKRVV